VLSLSLVELELWRAVLDLALDDLDYHAVRRVLSDRERVERCGEVIGRTVWLQRKLQYDLALRRKNQKNSAAGEL
jgi:hypothetical protein